MLADASLQTQQDTIFRHILVAVDGSEESKQATRVAARLTRRMGVGSELTILHVVTESSALYESGVSLDAFEDDDRVEGDEILGDAATIAGERDILNIKKAIARAHDSPVRGIVDYAKKNSIDLIVMGTRDLGGIERIFMGSVAAGVVQHAECAVLVVK
ncbi:MAG: universal stress protein [Thermoplasmatota archaeon]